MVPTALKVAVWNTCDLFLTLSSGQALFSASCQPLLSWLSALRSGSELGVIYGVNKCSLPSLAGLAEGVFVPSWTACSLQASSVPVDFCVCSDPSQPDLT